MLFKKSISFINTISNNQIYRVEDIINVITV